MKKVLIRADASNQVGVGHLMRSVALAQHLYEQGVYVYLLTVPWEKKLSHYLKQQKFKVQLLDLSTDKCGGEKDLQSVLEELKRGYDWVLLDNHYFGFHFQQAVRKAGPYLLLMDDGLNYPLCADLVVHQGIGQSGNTRWKSQVTRYVSGTEYIIFRSKLLKFSRRKEWGSKNILVTLGGSDQSDTLSKIIRAISQLSKFELHIKVMHGFSQAIDSSLISGCKHKVEACEATLEIQELYEWADLAICAAGTSCLELAYFGVVGVVGILIDHQKSVAETLSHKGIFKSVGWYQNITERDIATALQKLLEDPETVKGMREKALHFVDGKGAERILSVMQEFEMKNRHAQETIKHA